MNIMAPRKLSALSLALLAQSSLGLVDQKVFDIKACPDYTLYSSYAQ